MSKVKGTFTGKRSSKTVANELAISENSDVSNRPGKGPLNIRKQSNLIEITILPPGMPKCKCVTRY